MRVQNLGQRSTSTLKRNLTPADPVPERVLPVLDVVCTYMRQSLSTTSIALQGSTSKRTSVR